MEMELEDEDQTLIRGAEGTAWSTQAALAATRMKNRNEQ